MYKLNSDGSVLLDNQWIPNDPANSDYQKFLRWQQSGNIPELVKPAVPISPNWDQLTNQLRNSAIWQKVVQAALVFPKAQFWYNLIYGSLTSTNNLADLQYALGALRSAMTETAIGDFTASEISAINMLLKNNNFTIVLS